MSSARLYALASGDAPLLINVPHAGIELPAYLRERLTPVARTTPDTDWHVPQLYRFAIEQGASLMAATHSRYIIDLNRDPENRALYPGADNTELCPLRTFDQAGIYHSEMAPHTEEIKQRRLTYWQPYHAALAGQIDAIKARHGFAILLDAHSIRSEVPRFFAGRLPDLNLGTADGVSCSPGLQSLAFDVLRDAQEFSSVLNGRFKGGYITRRYGKPAQQVHALQLEIAQASYMNEAPPYDWDAVRAEPLIAVLRRLVDALLEWRPS